MASRNLATSLKRRSRGDPMQAFDALPADLRQWLAGAVLLASFYVNGASFLGYAILAEKRGLETREQGEKSLYFSAGLLEGTETILFFALLCLVPGAFAPLAFVFAALCGATALSRILLARRQFR